MDTKQIVAFAILASLLAVSASPVGALQASGQLVVGSQHTSFGTDGEEPAPTLVENTTIRGTGDSASIGLKYKRDESTATRPADTTSTTTSNQIGLTVEPKTDLAGVNLTLSSNTNGATTAYLQRASDGATLDTASISNGQAELEAEMEAGATYHVVVDADGASYTAGYYDSNEFPYTSEYINITRAIRDGASNNYAWVIKSVTAQTAELKTTGRAISANHTVENVEEGQTNLSLVNASATVEWQAWTGSTWAVVNTSTYSSSGNHSIDLSGTSYQTWRANVSFEVTGQDATARLHDESLLFADHAPTATLQSPTGGEQLSASTVTLKTLINDTEFGTAQGESIAVEFQTKEPGSSTFTTEDTVTATQNGTVSTSITASTGGAWEWRVVATDQYGEQTTTTAETFDVPGNLYLRNVSNTSELVDEPVNVTVRFFGGEIETRPASNGTVDLSGLPVDEIFIVEVEPDQDYHPRTVFIDDIYSQDSVYLLNKSATSVESRFILEDPTGEFGPESIIYIQKPIEVNGSVEYRTAYADRFGVEGVTAVLEQGDRYFIKLRRDGGTVQDIGPYRADVGETVTVRPGNPTVELGEYEDGWATGTEIRSRTLEFRYSDPDGETDQLKVWVHERNNESNVLGANRTFSSIGNVSGTYTLTENQSAREWVVNYEITRNGNTFTKSQPISNNPNLVPELSREWRLIVGIGLLFISAGIFSMLNAGIGGIVVSLEGGILWWTGWLEGATAGAAVVIALFIGVVAHIYTRR